MDKLWDIIKDYRSRYLITNIDILKTNLMCFSSDTEVLYSITFTNAIDQLKSIIDSFEIEVIISGSQHKNFDINLLYSYERMQYVLAGEMFIYFSICPKYMFDWTKLYVDLIYHAHPDIIIQTLNRIWINGKLLEDKITADISKRIIEKITTKMSLEFQSINGFYKGIPKITIEISETFNNNISHKTKGNFIEESLPKSSNKFYFQSDIDESKVQDHKNHKNHKDHKGL